MIDKRDSEILRADFTTDLSGERVGAFYFGRKPKQVRVYSKTLELFDAGELPLSTLQKVLDALPESYRIALVDQVRGDLNRAIHLGECYLKNERQQRGLERE